MKKLLTVIATLATLSIGTTAYADANANANARGIKDNGVKSCGNCGLTGKQKPRPCPSHEGENCYPVATPSTESLGTSHDIYPPKPKGNVKADITQPDSKNPERQ
jgi:hypothetical protein